MWRSLPRTTTHHHELRHHVYGILITFATVACKGMLGEFEGGDLISFFFLLVMTDDVQGVERGGDGDSYLLVQHTQIYYFDEKVDRTSTYPDGIRAEFARGGRVRFWRVGCPFDVVMMVNLFA